MAERDDIGREVLHGMYRRAGLAPVDFEAFQMMPGYGEGDIPNFDEVQGIVG